MAHEAGVPGDVVAAGNQRVAQGSVAAAVADVPLASGDDLERAGAALVELDRVGDGPCLAQHLATGLQQFDDLLLHLLREQASQQRVRLAPLAFGNPLRCFGGEATVKTDQGARRQVQFAPPRDVGGVAEGADHCDAGALLRVGEVVCKHGDFHPEQGRANDGAEQRLVSQIVGVGDHGDAAGQQLGASGVDDQIAAAVKAMERDLVVRAGHLAVFHLGLCDRSALVDVVQGGCVLLVRLAASKVAQEGALADAPGPIADGRIEQRPVDRQAEAAEEFFEHLLVEMSDLAAQLDEVGTAHRNSAVVLGNVAVVGRGEVRVVRQRRVAADAGDVLHAALGRQAVVVPSQRVENGLALHALIAGDGVGVCVAEHVADVQAAADRGRWRVDGEYAFAGHRAVEAVSGVGLPPLHPAGLDTVE